MFPCKQLQLFMKKIEIKSNGCWEWQAAKYWTGYGCYSIRGKNMVASRAMLTLLNGPLDPKCVVMHKCDNPPCVNPKHLKIATQLENIRDCKAKGRHSPPPRHGKLSQEIAETIRADPISIQDAAIKYGVSYTSIWTIRAGKAYRRINVPS